uniref:GPN-loop GTPase 3 n=1 Tax=Cacopsylla melanoneura TaxID=428564 RepID=A0A8D8RZ27_9HEMI
MRFAQLVMGPAGSGKSTYCATMLDHAESENKPLKVINLDPAAEYFNYEPAGDIRELIHVEDAMEDENLQFGPNGGLVFCMEYLMENSDWLKEVIGEELDEDYIILDCPGQIELYTHMNVIKKLVDLLHGLDFRVCGVYLMDVQFMVDGAKFLSGTMSALTTMVNMEIPHVNVLTKMDLLSKSARKQIDRYLDPDPHVLLSDLDAAASSWNAQYRRLTESFGRIIEDFSLVRYYPLNIKSEESVGDLWLTINNIIQYGEDADVKAKDVDYPDPDEQEDYLCDRDESFS